MFARRQNVVVAPRGGCQRGCHGQALDGLVGRHAQEGHIAVLGQHDVLELVLHVEAVALGALELLGNQEHGAEVVQRVGCVRLKREGVSGRQHIEVGGPCIVFVKYKTCKSFFPAFILSV